MSIEFNHLDISGIPYKPREDIYFFVVEFHRKCRSFFDFRFSEKKGLIKELLRSLSFVLFLSKVDTTLNDKHKFS